MVGNHSKATCVGAGSGTGAGSARTAQDGSDCFFKIGNDLIFEGMKVKEGKGESGRERE